MQGFHHEALIWRQLAHPNLLPFFGVYFLQNDRSRLCLVSPWLENGNISVYLKRNPVGSNTNRLTLVNAAETSAGVVQLLTLHTGPRCCTWIGTSS
jgi:serine/threonine protein kinase